MGFRCGPAQHRGRNLIFAKGGKVLKRWIAFVVVVFAIVFIGNWLWKELSPYQSGPLADVTWRYNGKPNTLTVHLQDQQGQPLVASIMTAYTDDGDFDFTTNVKGEATIVCSGQVLFGIQTQRHTVFSKSLARFTGSPSLVKGLDFKIVAKRPDALSPPGGYDLLKYQPDADEALKKLDEQIKPEDAADDDAVLTHPDKTDEQ